MSSLARSLSPEDRKLQLKTYFKDLGVSGISGESLHSFLSSKSGHSFSPDLIAQIFQEAGVSSSDQLSLEDLVLGFYSVETLLKSKSDIIKQQIGECSIRLEDTKRQLIETRANDSFDEQSLLTINIISFSPSQPLKKPSVKVTLQEKSISTAPASNSRQPIWDETFTFKVKDPESSLSIEIVDSDSLGSVAVPLDLLNDQQAVRDCLHIKNKAGDLIGEIELSLQWIYDKLKYYEDTIRNLQTAIEADKDALRDIEIYYEELVGPIRNPIEEKTWVIEAPRKKDDKLAPQIFSVVFCTLCVLSMLVRPDFPNIVSALTNITYAFSIINDKRAVFGLLTIALVYDLLWVWAVGPHWMTAPKMGVKRFSLGIAGVNFLVKIALGLVFWKIS